MTRTADQALELLRSRAGLVANLSTTEDWQKRQAYVRGQLQQTIARGLPAKKPPLGVTVTGVVEASGYTVHKLYFQSQPQYFVTAGLFVPDPARFPPPRPAVLFASGHAAQSFRLSHANDASESYQLVANNLASKGFVVLAYDPPSQGERVMYFNTTSQLSDVGGCVVNWTSGDNIGGSCTTEHNYYGRQLLLNNVTASAMWLWDGTRALDVLLSYSLGSKPAEGDHSTPCGSGGVPCNLVDPQRVGMAGCSGGGTQTAYLSAYDSRVSAASIACYMSTFAVDFQYEGSADAEQQWPSGLLRGLDKPDLLTARAPKPTQVLLTTDDVCFPVQGGRQAYREQLAAFSALSPGTATSSSLRKSEAMWHHGYTKPNREALYGFFQSVFNVSGDSTELAVPPIPVSRLKVHSLAQRRQRHVGAQLVATPEVRCRSRTQGRS